MITTALALAVPMPVEDLKWPDLFAVVVVACLLLAMLVAIFLD